MHCSEDFLSSVCSSQCCFIMGVTALRVWESVLERDSVFCVANFVQFSPRMSIISCANSLFMSESRFCACVRKPCMHGCAETAVHWLAESSKLTKELLHALFCWRQRRRVFYIPVITIDVRCSANGALISDFRQSSRALANLFFDVPKSMTTN